MKRCKLLLPPMDVQGIRYTEVGAEVPLTEGDATMFAECGVVEIIGDTEPTVEPPAETSDEAEVVEITEAIAPEVDEPTAPVKAKAKR